jgi:hypothetical protein
MGDCGAQTSEPALNLNLTATCYRISLPRVNGLFSSRLKVPGTPNLKRIGRSAKWEVRLVEIQHLANDACRLLSLSIDDLYATLGCQLLVYQLPSKAAGIVSYLASVRSVSEARVLFERLRPAATTTDWGKGISVIADELKQDGTRYIADSAEELRKALDNEDILRLADDPSQAQLQILLMLVASVLKLPRDMEAIAATVTVILVKAGLRNFCRQRNSEKI